MKRLVQFLTILILSSSVVISQELTKSISFPKFVPYQNNHTEQNANNEKIDIKELGKDQSARWLSVDPFADKYPGWSPYVYVRNNSLILIDPKGLDDYYYNQDGSKITVEYSWWHNLWYSDNYYYQGSEQAPNSFKGKNYWEVEEKIGELLNEGAQLNLYENFDINPFVKANLSEGQFPLNIGEVLEKSPQKSTWDTKRALDPNGIYVMENKGYFRDYAGNAVWGGIMANAGYHHNIATTGAGMRQVYDAIKGNSRMYPTNMRGFFDDPRDTQAILYGYRRATIWFR